MVRTRHDLPYSIKYTLEEDLCITAGDFIEITGDVNIAEESFTIPDGKLGQTYSG